MKTLLRYMLIILLSMTVGVITAQENEGEDTNQLTFITVESGDEVTAAFEDEVNAHLYAFVGSAGDTVTITMTQSEDSTLDPYLVLLGASGEIYTADDDSGDLPLSAALEFDLPTDGTYFILATSFTGLRRGVFAEDEDGEQLGPQFYEIIVNGMTTPEALADAEELEFFHGVFELGDTNVLEITQPEPVFYITFTAEEGELVNIRTFDNGEGDPVDTALHLFDSNGERLAINDDADGFFAAIENFEIPRDGEYLVFATAYNFADAYRDDEWGQAGTFALTIE